jgi:hypothetical protein
VAAIVLIGPAESLGMLAERLDPGAQLRPFTSTESVEAIEYIVSQKPRIVIVESEFSGTSRGAALIARIKDDPDLSDCEVRIVTRDLDGGNRITTAKRKSGSGIRVAPGRSTAALDARGTRRVPRVLMEDGLAVSVDGNPAVLVDLSTHGAQVLSKSVLRPNQRVRVSLSEGKHGLRCSGAIAWASFEMPNGQPPRYRAGVRFQNVDADAVSQFAERHRAVGSQPKH